MRDYADHGKHPGPLPSPGVYARHNAVDTPALLPDGTPVGDLGLPDAAAARHGPDRPGASADDSIETARRDRASSGPRAGIDGDPQPTATDQRRRRTDA